MRVRTQTIQAAISAPFLENTFLLREVGLASEQTQIASWKPAASLSESKNFKHHVFDVV